VCLLTHKHLVKRHLVIVLFFLALPKWCVYIIIIGVWVCVCTLLWVCFTIIFMNEWVVIVTCKQLVWSTRIDRNMPFWILCLILGSDPGTDLPLEVTGSCSRVIGTWSTRYSTYRAVCVYVRGIDSSVLLFSLLVGLGICWREGTYSDFFRVSPTYQLIWLILTVWLPVRIRWIWGTNRLRGLQYVEPPPHTTPVSGRGWSGFRTGMKWVEV
jgi:hypothetical protein